MNKVIIIAGPTASGKSALALEIAKRANGEIVSADSMQIYRHMDIGTAKATKQERSEIRHHMIDIAEPYEEYSVSRYGEEAYRCVTDIFERGKLPIVCGGTGLYINALIRGNDFLSADKDRKTRSRLENEYDVLGGVLMRERLLSFDKESYEKLHQNDKKRIIRALEVYEDYGITISEHNERTRCKADRLDSIFICLNPVPREFLYDRINKRVDIMLKEGLLEETKLLLEKNLLVNTAAQAIGYKEMLGYINNDMTFESAAELLKQKTRNYAKRQLTWFKSQKKIIWVDYDEETGFANLLQKVTEILLGFGIKLDY